MENPKLIEPQARSLRIHERETDDAAPDSRSVLNRLSAECLETFKALLKAANTSLSKTNLTNLKQSRESLVLWVHGYGVLEGNLDEKLEKSRTLRRTTLQLLAGIGNTLTDRLLPQLNLDKNAIHVGQLNNLVGEAQSSSQANVHDSEDEDCDSDSSSISESSDINEIIEDLKTDMQCLMDLDSLLQAPVILAPQTRPKEQEQTRPTSNPDQLKSELASHPNQFLDEWESFSNPGGFGRGNGDDQDKQRKTDASLAKEGPCMERSPEIGDSLMEELEDSVECLRVQVEPLRNFFDAKKGSGMVAAVRNAAAPTISSRRLPLPVAGPGQTTTCSQSQKAISEPAFDQPRSDSSAPSRHSSNSTIPEVERLNASKALAMSEPRNPREESLQEKEARLRRELEELNMTERVRDLERQVEAAPTMLKRTLGLQDDRFSQYIGPTTDFEPSLINLSPFDPHDQGLLSRGTLRKVSDHDIFLMLPDHSTPGHEHVTQDAEHVESIVAPHGRKLIDIYFRVVHPGFPITQKHVFLEKYERSYREFSPPLLAAVYILAINWWDQSEDLSQLPRPNVRELESIVRTTLEEACFRPKLSTIQAGLLLSQRPEGDQWAPTAQLVALGHELGLHLDCSNWKIPPWEKGLRKRLAWALYMQDKWGALVHGRPSHIFASNWGVQALTSNDFPDVEWDENDPDEKQDIERGRMLFTQVVQLSGILSEILDTFYTLQAMQTVTNAGARGTQLVLSLAKPIQLKLKEWYGGLPQLIRLDSSYSSTNPAWSRLSSIGYLHLAYFAAEITLHRRIIRSLASASATVDPYVQHICRSAAKARLISAMDFVNRLTPNHLRSFWYFASKTNFALIGTFGSLLWATSPGREEADWYRRRLGEYRWTLSASSKPGEGKGLTEFAMTMLDISTGLLKQLPEKPSMSRNGSLADLSASALPTFNDGGILDSLSNLASADVSEMHTPHSGDDYNSDDDMEDEPLQMVRRGEDIEQSRKTKHSRGSVGQL